MEGIKNSYFSLAFNDLRYLFKYDCDDELSYNRVAVESQQIVEKVLKGLIETCDLVPVKDKEYLLKTHNIRKLGKVVNLQYGVNLDLSDLAFLKDFYFEARYPGEEFIIVNRTERDKCVNIVLDILKKVIHLCSNVPSEIPELLENLSAPAG